MFHLRRSALTSSLLWLAATLPVAAQSLDDTLARAQQEQSSGAYRQAAADYATSTRLDPSVAELWANRGLMEYLAGSKQDAIVTLHHALTLKPTLVSALLFLGKAYLDTGQPGKALSPLEHARKLQPQDPQILLALGNADAALTQWPNAAEAHRAALAADPQLAAAWFALGVDELSLIDQQGRRLADGSPGNPWAGALYADELATQGRPSEAAQVYGRIATAFSPAQAACVLKTVQQQQEDASKADANIDRTLAARAGNSAPSCEPADASRAYWRRDFSTSATAAAKRLEVAPGDPAALYWSVKANEQLAVDALGRFEQLGPHSPASEDMLGDLYRRRRQPELAIQQYQRALAMDPNDLVAYLGLSAAWLSAGQIDKSMQAAQTGLDHQPIHPQLNLLMADALVEDHRYDEAKPYLAKSHPLPAELDGRLHALKGAIAAHDGDTSTAIAELAQALPTDQDGSLHYQLYRLYIRTGREKEAERTLAEVKSIEGARREHAAVAVHGADAQSTE